MPIKAKELFIKENVVKTLMKRKAVKKNFYMYLIENVELCTRKECYQWEKLCSILKVFLSSFKLWTWRVILWWCDYLGWNYSAVGVLYFITAFIHIWIRSFDHLQNDSSAFVSVLFVMHSTCQQQIDHFSLK